MPMVKLEDLVNPKKIWENIAWIAVGAIGGVVVYQMWINTFVHPAATVAPLRQRSPIFSNVPTYGQGEQPTSPFTVASANEYIRHY